MGDTMVETERRKVQYSSKMYFVNIPVRIARKVGIEKGTVLRIWCRGKRIYMEKEE